MTMWNAALQVPSELSIVHLYPIDGAVHAVRPGETAWSCRDATWSMVIAGIDPDPSKAKSLKAWARGYWEAVHPYNLGGAYVNFMMEEGEDRIRATYGDNYDRLVAIKRKYDPDEFLPCESEHPAGLIRTDSWPGRRTRRRNRTGPR